MGNICRSPMAEAVFADMVAKAGLSNEIEVDSVGIGSWHVGEPAHRGTLAILKQNNIPYNGRARQIAKADIERSDYVLAMDRETLSGIWRLGAGGNAEIGLFLRYAQARGTVDMDEVPDPYYDNTFDRAYSLITRGCEALLDHIRREHALA